MANLGKATPLVFLNSCQIGAGGIALTDIGGWARQFLAAGAGAFIGAQWDISDHTAFSFATDCMTCYVPGRPVGEAVRRGAFEGRTGRRFHLVSTLCCPPHGAD